MRTSSRVVCLASALVACAYLLSEARQDKGSTGYTDTPMLPGNRWHVHDSGRPQPPEVSPGTTCTQDTPDKPPSDAVVLFDGTGLSKWRTESGRAPGWIVRDGAAQVPPEGTPDGGSIWTRDSFGNCQLHVEWSTPDPPVGDIMNRGNSGVFFLGLYELQVFDSFRGGIYADGQAAAIYGQYPPLVNASLRPGQWQKFDALFTAPRFEGGALKSPAYLTVLHNGVAVHNHRILLGSTGHRMLAEYKPHDSRGPLMLQAHGNPVRYRNIWVRPLRDDDDR